MPLTTPLPQLFAERLHNDLPSQAEALLASLDEVPSTSIRLNRSKGLSPEALSLPLGAPIPWYAERGFYLTDRPLFAADPLWHAGGYYVQEASSMVIALAQVYFPNRPLQALDLCAAPGGKSTLLLDLLPEGSSLISNEFIRTRAQVLSENIQKWGVPATAVTSTDAQHLGKMRDSFDLILVDAPCSGEGMFRKEEEARRQWSPGLVKSCAALQREIVEAIWPALRPGGLMIYSTCTFSTDEDETIVQMITEELGAETIELADLPEGIWRSNLTPYPCYRMMPHRLRGEGLFFALLRKRGELQEAPVKEGKNKKKSRNRASSIGTKVPAQLHRWLTGESSDYVFTESSDNIISAYPKSFAPLIDQLQENKIPILCAGVTLAEIKGKSLIPQQSLALSTALNESAFPCIELSLDESISYLSREALTLPSDVPTGIVLVKYRGMPLGFVKHLGNRTNNLYSQAWRIRNPELIRSALTDQEVHIRP